MPVYSLSTFLRCAVVAQEGAPILFEHANSAHRSRVTTADVRRMHAWEFFDDPRTETTTWGREVAAAIRELGASGREVAVDRLGTQDRRLRSRDAGGSRGQDPDEIRLFEINAGIVMGMLMVLVVEIYAGEVGAREGVKLGDQVHITQSGSSVLAPYPLDAALLA